MKPPFISRRLYEAALADRERIRGERDQFAKDRNSQRAAAETAARQFAEADAANRRLEGRLIELGRRLSRLAESDPEYAAQLERRVQRLTRGASRYLAAYWKARAEIRDLTTRLGRATEGLIDLRGRLSAAEERARKAEALLETAGARPIDGAPAHRADEAARLRAELHRSEKARAALDEKCRDLQNVNEVQARQLREHTEGVGTP